MGEVIALIRIMPGEVISDDKLNKIIDDIKNVIENPVRLGKIDLFGGTVRYGRYVNRKLTVEEVLERVRRLAEHPKVEVRNEGPSSEETPILSVRFGNPDGPRFLLLAGKHGSEWENVYGILITIEQLLGGDVIDLEQVCVVAVPLLNPYGYRNGTRLNANGVDLNRQLRKDWDTFRGWTDEVIEPWTFDFKGTARGDEPEEFPLLLRVRHLPLSKRSPSMLTAGDQLMSTISRVAEGIEESTLLFLFLR